MVKRNFWNLERKFTNKTLAQLILIFIFISGITLGLFINFVFPWLASSSGLGFLLPRFPIIVNKTEEIRINEGIKTNEVLDRVGRSVVTVMSYQNTLDPRDSGFRKIDFGKGIVVTSDGIILTTQELVGNFQSKKFLVITSDQNQYEAEVLSFDSASDLAAIKISAENLPVASFKSSFDLLIGDKLVAITPGEDQLKNQAFILDLTSRPFDVVDFPTVKRANVSSAFLAVSPAEPGKSSTIIASRDSQIAGMITKDGILTGDFLRSSLEILLAEKNFSRPILGAHYTEITPNLAKLLELPEKYGALVLSAPGKPAVIFGGPAYNAGLREGDFIYKINNVEFGEGRGFEQKFFTFKSGDKIEVEYLRGQEIITVEIII